MAAISETCCFLSQEKAKRGLCGGGGGCIWDSLAVSSFLLACVGAFGFAAALVGSRIAREWTNAAIS